MNIGCGNKSFVTSNIAVIHSKVSFIREEQMVRFELIERMDSKELTFGLNYFSYRFHKKK